MIIFCHLLNDNSGSPIILRDAISVLDPDGHNSMLFVGSQGRGALEKVCTPISRYWYRRSRFRIFTLFTYLASQVFLYRALTKAQLPTNTIVYVNTLLPFGAAIWARRNQCRLLYHIHEVSISPRLLQYFLIRIIEKTADCVIYVSEDNRFRMPLRGVHSAVIPNPITPQIAAVGSATPYKPRRSGKFEVLMLASPRNFKGIPEFLKLARRLAARLDIHFTLVLNGSDSEIGNYLPDSSVPDNVKVHPRTDHPEHFYAGADVLLNLSRVDQWVETFGLTIVEGMAFGLPVIAPPVGGPIEIITNGQEGYLIDSRNGEKLERTLLNLADSPECTELISAAARRRAAHYTIARFSDGLRTQISFLTSNPKAGEIRK
ncbi:MAG: glycosyltransferase involved in cell wall biosynthesis [Gammaproteobacteria bacterium]|jgi:glycosyltransferase involved in cell wall biosynthesis